MTSLKLTIAALLASAGLAGSAETGIAPLDTDLACERGRDVVGMTHLFNVDYIRAGQHGVTGMARVVVTPEQPGRPTDFIRLAVFNYRWRHLGLFPQDTYQHGRWHSLVMAPGPEPDVLRTTEEIPVPDVPCDLEFFFTAIPKAQPYYAYVDYTGRNAPVSRSGYTEEIQMITGRIHRVSAEPLPSGGADWYIRTRRARGSVRSMRLVE